MEVESLLGELAREIAVCEKCPLSRTRLKTVPGEGAADARLMFVGEAPGANEDASGRPFVGAAGQYLNGLLKQAGIERRAVFITNTVKCRPPQNRDPQPEEVAACRDYLDAQIAIVEPSIICPLGNSALKRLLAPALQITSSRGRLFRKSGILYFPLLHPAAALRRSEWQPLLEQDIFTLKELLERQISDEEVTVISSGSPCAAESGESGDAAEASTSAGTSPTPGGKKSTKDEAQNLSLF
jgi:DNA polymerase